MTKLFAYPGYARFWGADTVSTFGTYITTVALPTLAVIVLKASDAQVGLLNGARWTPYLLFGLLAGVIADRYRRRPILVATDLARGTLLLVVAVLAAAHIVNIYELVGFVFVFGTLSLLYDAAHQSQRLGRGGVGRIMAAERLAEPCAWALAPLALSGTAGWTMVAGAQFFAWLALGASGPNEMAYRQSATPDRLQGRVNATVRSLNWGTITFGAPIGGLLAQHLGYRPALWIGVGGMAVAGVVAALSPMRKAMVTEVLADSGEAAGVGV